MGLRIKVCDISDDTPFPFTDPVVQVSEPFQSGRHYWEVRVDDKPKWMVEVCTVSLPSNDTPLLKEHSGHWRFQLHKGVYIDRGSVSLGEISFYNLTTSSHIHSFFDGFSGILKTYFYVRRDPKPLTICAAPNV
ncbi:tripartite motif-containing protein 75-like [Rhynchocyon petersi]